MAGRFSVQRELGEIHGRIKSVEQTLTNVNKTLSGNGQQGIVQDVNQMKGAVKALKWVTGVALPILSLAVTMISIKGCA